MSYIKHKIDIGNEDTHLFSFEDQQAATTYSPGAISTIILK